MTRGSIVIPVHNEAAHLAASLAGFFDDLGPLSPRIGEILLMENGSGDGTMDVCRRLEEEYPGLVSARRMEIASYGEAVKAGLQEAKEEAVFVLECDVLDAGFIVAAFEALDGGQADLVVGSKRLAASNDGRPFVRRSLTFLFNLGLRLLFHFRGTDTHGLKAFRREAARALAAASITGGEVFQTEIVLLAPRLGFQVVERPVRLREIRRTPVRIMRRLPMIWRLVGELRRSLGRYPRPKGVRP